MSLPIFASHSVTYTVTNNSDKDLVADGNAALPAARRALAPKAPCKRLAIRGAGVIHVQYASGAQDTWTALAGEIVDAEIVKILSDTSTVTNVTAYFGT